MQTCDNARASTSRNCYDDEIRPLEYWSTVQMATTVSCNTKSLIVGKGIRQWHSVGFLSWFTGDGTRKLVSLYSSAKILSWKMCLELTDSTLSALLIR